MAKYLFRLFLVSEVRKTQGNNGPSPPTLSEISRLGRRLPWQRRTNDCHFFFLLSRSHSLSEITSAGVSDFCSTWTHLVSSQSVQVFSCNPSLKLMKLNLQIFLIITKMCPVDNKIDFSFFWQFFLIWLFCFLILRNNFCILWEKFHWNKL